MPDEPQSESQDLSKFFGDLMGEVDKKINTIKEEHDKSIADLVNASEQNNSVLDQLLDWIEGEKQQKQKTDRESKKNHLVVPPQDLTVQQPTGETPQPAPTSTPAEVKSASGRLREKLRRLV